MAIYSSCQKTTDELEIIEQNEILIGQDLYIKVQTYDTILQGSHSNPKDFTIDINNDNIPDIKITSKSYENIWYYSRSKIECLNQNTEFFEHSTNDTIYYYVGYDSAPGPNNTYEYNERHNYSCNRIEDTDSIYLINYQIFEITPLMKNDILKKNDIFQSDSIVLDNGCDSYYDEPVEIAPDTFLIRSYRYYNDCFNFPDYKIRYIGVRFSSGKGIKLGWIKLVIYYSSKIAILESGLQY
ncbi:MAG: hypothetical protein K8R53_12840 [Bacteroidales bacterium]|nr:hypothetical protein [Bacteroidales bacterium]